MNHRQYLRELPGAECAVVFLHGILESPEQFEDFVDSVKERVSIFNLLLPGHGATAEDFAASGVEKWRDYVFAWMERLEKQYSRIILVGHSMGSLLAMEAAIRFPKKVCALFLMAVPLYIRVKPEGVLNTFKVLSRRARQRDAIVLAAQRAFSVRCESPVFFFRWIPRYLELFCMASSDRDLVCRLPCPAIVYQSGKDEFVGKRSADCLKNAPQISVKTAARSRHFYYLPQERKEILSAFHQLLRKTAGLAESL